MCMCESEGTMARYTAWCDDSATTTLNFPCKCRLPSMCSVFSLHKVPSGWHPRSLIYNNIWPAHSCLLFIQLETITWRTDQWCTLSPVLVDTRRSPLLQCAPAVPGEGTAHERTGALSRPIRQLPPAALTCARWAGGNNIPANRPPYLCKSENHSEKTA